MGKLDGKVILVTGGSRGIGLAIAQRLGSEGARLVLVARHETALRKAGTEVPGGALVIKADVTQAKQVERLFKVVEHEMGRLDVLINNAGVFTYKPFVSTSLADWQKNLDTNLTALYLWHPRRAASAAPQPRRASGEYSLRIQRPAFCQLFGLYRRQVRRAGPDAGIARRTAALEDPRHRHPARLHQHAPHERVWLSRLPH